MISIFTEANEVATEHRPSRHKSTTDVIVFGLDVKGDTMEASASDKAIPACAILKAPQSLPPSPHRGWTADYESAGP